MSDHQLQQLIKMINQISSNNLHHGDETAAATMVATNLEKFWARSMKAQIIDYRIQNGTELSAISCLAVEHLKRRSEERV